MTLAEAIAKIEAELDRTKGQVEAQDASKETGANRYHFSGKVAGLNYALGALKQTQSELESALTTAQREREEARAALAEIRKQVNASGGSGQIWRIVNAALRSSSSATKVEPTLTYWCTGCKGRFESRTELDAHLSANATHS